jgi:hypothetical protein
MSSGFTKTFRLVALVLLLSVTQVYVLGRPAAANTAPSTRNTKSVNKPVVTDHQLNFIKQNQVASEAQLASERSLTFAPKSPLSLAFTRTGVEKAAINTAFLKIKKGAYDPLLSPKPRNAKSAQSTTANDDSDDNEGDRKALYIASAIVIGACVAAFIGFRSNRDNDNIRGN